MMTKQDLLAFEEDIKEVFEAGKIRAPVHFCGGNEEALIDLFKQVKPDDWVFSTHRSHYHALLKDIPPEWVKKEIVDGHSITLNSSRHNFFSSAIIGGILPIALGVALALRLEKKPDRVWCFVGDMAGETGVFHEASKYARGHDLPITFVIEDNGFSVDTPTRETWGHQSQPSAIYYQYKRVFPHHGTGRWLVF